MDDNISKSLRGSSESANRGVPQILTGPFEEELDELPRIRFLSNRSEFIRLTNEVIVEFELQDKIESVTVHLETVGHAMIWREPNDDWPSRRIHLDMYPNEDRYMNKQLLRHEFGHESDRQNLMMEFDPKIYARWRGTHFWALNLAMDISLDSRLAELGLGRTFRLANFQSEVEGQHDYLFNEAWAKPPMTWPKIEDLAKELKNLSRAKSRSGTVINKLRFRSQDHS